MHLCCKSIINDLKYEEFTFVTGLFKTDMTLIYISTIANLTLKINKRYNLIIFLFSAIAVSETCTGTDTSTCIHTICDSTTQIMCVNGACTCENKLDLSM